MNKVDEKEHERKLQEIRIKLKNNVRYETSRASKGWLSPQGEFFSCKYGDPHAIAAKELFGCDEGELEDKGYLKVFNRGRQSTVFADILTPMQREYVEDNDIQVEFPFKPSSITKKQVAKFLELYAK